jgi:diguanylate cyclase (GGDEF)-like protein
MKRLLPIFVILFACTAAAWAAPTTPLTNLREIRAISNEQASQHPPVAFEATVSYFRRLPLSLYAQDGDSGVYIFLTKDISLTPGDRVLVRGIMRPSFRPVVESNNVIVLRHGEPLRPEIASYSGLVNQQYLCRLVTVHAVIRSADLKYAGNEIRSTYLHLLTNAGTINATIENSDRNRLKDLLDAEVDITGVAAVIFDSKMQQTGVLLHSASMDDVKILKRAQVDPWSLPVTSIDNFFSRRKVSDQTPRVRIHGTITYNEPGEALVLQDGAKSVWIDSATDEPLNIGDVADATGFPDVRDGFLKLTHGEVQVSHLRAPVAPRPESWQNLATSDNIRFGHIYELVSIEGQVVTEAREDEQDEYILNSDGHLFSAIYRHSDKVNKTVLPSMKMVPLGSRVRVSGICLEQRIAVHPNDPVPFEIMLRSFDDIEVVGKPSLLNIRNLIILVGLLLAIVVAVGARSWAIERKVRRQTAALAALEHRRSRILEDISGSRPLAEILEEITELISFQFNNTPCWCDVTDGARLGNCPPQTATLRIAQEKIPAHSGPPLGIIFAAFNSLTQPAANESEALSMAAGLASLAIETRRLYADLLHRSEFDLLTDIHNRFSLEKHLDAQVEQARSQATVFGLIYIDLDHFKQVNDTYGHQAGDQYLQEVALRMKKQLRPHDKLARLGGDEFAVLVPMVRSRAEVEEIAQRLERSFDEPFLVEGYFLHGAASIGIALYPENGATRNSLLSAADDAMYALKRERKKHEEAEAMKMSQELESMVRS